MANTNRIQIQSEEMTNFHPIGNKKKVKLKSKDQIIDIHKELIAGCKRNEAKAQKELYLQYSVAMFNTCKRMLNSREDAQDVLQESFIAAFKGIKNFNGKSTFGAWLKRIVINKCINHLNRQKIVRFEQLSTQTEGEHNKDDQPLEVNTVLINTAIQKLPTGCRMVFVMKAMEGYDHQEIAQSLDIKIGTSKSQYSRARLLLQESLKEIQK